MLALPTHLNSQCFCYGFIPNCLCLLCLPSSIANPIQSSYLYPSKIKLTWTWCQKRRLDCQIRSMIYQKKSILQWFINPLLKCKYITTFLLWLRRRIKYYYELQFFGFCYWDSLLCYSYPKVNGLNKSLLFPW